MYRAKNIIGGTLSTTSFREDNIKMDFKFILYEDCGVNPYDCTQFSVADSYELGNGASVSVRSLKFMDVS
jgi:hypothetical protein